MATNDPDAIMALEVLREMLKATGVFTAEVQAQLSTVVQRVYSAGTRDGIVSMRETLSEEVREMEDVDPYADAEQRLAKDAASRQSNAPLCPDCNSEMVVRDGKFGRFWGCVKFPDCNGSRNI